MVYDKLTVEQLEQFPYPNLIAELIESGYSICTLGEHMGLKRRRKEDDQEIWGKLRGEIEITAQEGFALARLFGTNVEYLFKDHLSHFNGKSAAYWRWIEENRWKEEELQRICERDEIEACLREKPQLTKLMRKIMDLSDDQLDEYLDILKKLLQVTI